MNKNTSVSEQLEAMEAVIKTDLKKCCSEIEFWHRVGTLPITAVVCKAAEKLTDSAFRDHTLVHVENAVNRLARQFVIGI